MQNLCLKPSFANMRFANLRRCPSRLALILAMAGGSAAEEDEEGQEGFFSWAVGRSLGSFFNGPIKTCWKGGEGEGEEGQTEKKRGKGEIYEDEIVRCSRNQSQKKGKKKGIPFLWVCKISAGIRFHSIFFFARRGFSFFGQAALCCIFFFFAQKKRGMKMSSGQDDKFFECPTPMQQSGFSCCLLVRKCLLRKTRKWRELVNKSFYSDQLMEAEERTGCDVFSFGFSEKLVSIFFGGVMNKISGEINSQTWNNFWNQWLNEAWKFPDNFFEVIFSLFLPVAEDLNKSNETVCICV